MELQVQTSSGGGVVRLSGRLEFTDHDRLNELVDQMDGWSGPRFVLDVADLEFIDSAGLGMLLILQEEGEQRGRRLVVRGPRGDVRRSLDLSRIGEIVTIED